MGLITVKSNDNYGYTKKSAIVGSFIGSLLVVESTKKVVSINSTLNKAKSISEKKEYIKCFKGEVDDRFIKKTASQSIKSAKKYMKTRAIVGFLFAQVLATGLGFGADLIKNKFFPNKSQKVESKKVGTVKTQK